MNIRPKKFAATVLGVLSLNVAFASDSIRCGNRLVTLGDSRAVVRYKCGEADDIAHSFITERISGYAYGRARFTNGVEVEVQIEAESWLYNFGPHRFMSRLRFVDGRLDSIETLDYGFDRDSSR